MEEPVHVHKSNYYKGKNLFHLLIPIMVFGLLLGLYFITYTRQENNQIATTAETNVLGEEDASNNPK